MTWMKSNASHQQFVGSWIYKLKIIKKSLIAQLPNFFFSFTGNQISKIKRQGPRNLLWFPVNRKKEMERKLGETEFLFSLLLLMTWIKSTATRQSKIGSWVKKEEKMEIRPLLFLYSFHNNPGPTSSCHFVISSLSPGLWKE